MALVFACLVFAIPAGAVAPVAAGGVVAASSVTDEYTGLETCDGEGEIRLVFHAATNRLSWSYVGACAYAFMHEYSGSAATCTGDYHQRVECSRNQPRPDSGSELDFSFTLEYGGAFSMRIVYRSWSEECNYYNCYSFLDTEHVLDLEGRISRVDTKVPNP